MSCKTLDVSATPLAHPCYSRKKWGDRVNSAVLSPTVFLSPIRTNRVTSLFPTLGTRTNSTSKGWEHFPRRIRSDWSVQWLHLQFAENKQRCPETGEKQLPTPEVWMKFKFWWTWPEDCNLWSAIEAWGGVFPATVQVIEFNHVTDGMGFLWPWDPNAKPQTLKKHVAKLGVKHQSWHSCPGSRF